MFSRRQFGGGRRVHALHIVSAIAQAGGECKGKYPPGPDFGIRERIPLPQRLMVSQGRNAHLDKQHFDTTGLTPGNGLCRILLITFQLMRDVCSVSELRQEHQWALHLQCSSSTAHTHCPRNRDNGDLNKNTVLVTFKSGGNSKPYVV